MVDTVIRLSSVLSYNPPLVSYWMTIVKLSPIFPVTSGCWTEDSFSADTDVKVRTNQLLLEVTVGWNLLILEMWGPRMGNWGAEAKRWVEKEQFGQRCQSVGARRGGRGGDGLRATFWHHHHVKGCLLGF